MYHWFRSLLYFLSTRDRRDSVAHQVEFILQMYTYRAHEQKITFEHC